jgi:hypothetical protein
VSAEAPRRASGEAAGADPLARSWAARPLAVLVAVLAAGGCAREGSLPPGSGQAARAPMRVPPPAAPLEWGLYQIYWEQEYGGRLADTLEGFASRPDYVMFYRDLGRPFPQTGVDAIHAAGATPIVSLELWRWHGPHEGWLERIVAGELDASFRDWARAAAADGRRVLLRFGFEANGDWFGWGGDPQGYVAAWRHVHGLFAEQGADHVEWVWSPNVVSVPETPENDLHRYWPGADVVDWVGLDGYNFGDRYDEWHDWEDFEQIFAPVVAECARRYPGLPIMVAETASAPDPQATGGEPGRAGPPGESADRKARWIREAHQAARSMPGLRAVIWFNLDKRREGELDWRVNSSPAALEAFNQTFAAPR